MVRKQEAIPKEGGKKITSHVFLSLTVACNVDGSGCNVYVHQVVDDPALNVSLVFVDQNFLSGVEDLDEAVVRLVCLVDCLILKLVVLDALAKVPDYVIWGKKKIIRIHERLQDFFRGLKKVLGGQDPQ